ncbi:MAG: hypothetical protein KJ773_09635, partial [Candidatus Thermoplasmatota archaeon]|nr:hypothetical protein [Candidatus Thermoplasmatota archaeon]
MAVEDIIVGRDPEDIQKYGKTGCIFIGKHVVGSGFESHLTNRVLMDVVRPHLILISGKRGSGKSYSGAVIAEEIMELPEDIRKGLTCLMIDTMGIFWSMKNPNEKDYSILVDWNMKPKGYPIQHIIPIGLRDFYEKSGITFDGVFAIKPSELSSADWALTFGIDLYDNLGILLERTLKKLHGTSYTV